MSQPWPQEGGAAYQQPVPAPRQPGQVTSGRASVPVQRPAPAPADPFAQQQAVAEPVARGLSAPAVTSAPLARPGTYPPERPPDGPPTGPEDGAGGPERTGPSGRVSRLRIGWHAIPRAGLRRVTVTPAAPPGLLLGRDQRQAPVPLRLFAPEPVRVTLVGGVWAAQLLIFRAFSVGVRVVVVTTEPRAWAGFGERATGQQNRLTVIGQEPGGPYGGTAQTPLMTVFDLGMTGPAASPPLGPWHTQLTILRQLDRPGVAAVQEAGLVVLQRLGGDEATLVAAALKLRPQSGQLLQSMNDDMMALIGDGDDRYLFLNQTPIEQQYVGLPRR
ncbi:hypothetical protein GCM10010112_54620 [Actinoplanes lobatus]|uniref:Uncharacterized protein n=1 Tax=Actinoplanes lobatus TaxID=113568 RepID=A0A7W7HF02_9ACTN|nr:hypothetical protein [Actinoplanes lobatus]MBB4749319.1 hypothetical protein [Actinoplanes lobatus]GGN79723.1 hypothetical protein GCM10010112_54620 [Actinoplanes lobatus]GIE40258.1 hypothetical protein Alo02nite_31560 [Actinoplanes lobatus]